MESTSSHICLSCNNQFTGKFCNLCGEKIVNDKERTILHFFGEFFHAITHADSKFLKTIKYLLTKPGFISSEYIKGKRKSYSSPISIFFIGNLIYLLLLPVDTLNTRFVSQVGGQVYSSVAMQMVEKKLEKSGNTAEELEIKYNEESGKVSKMMLILLVFLFSAPVALMFYHKNQFYFNHLMFSLEFINMILYGFFLILPISMMIVFVFFNQVLQLNWNPDINSPLITLLLLISLFVYLSLAARRVYEQRWILIIPKALMLTFSIAVLVLVYRFMLFCLTISLI
jgi:hypothetical protein